MIKKLLACCLLYAALPAQSAMTYTIDSAHSYVSSQVPIWTFAYSEYHANLPGEQLVPPTNYWQLDWQPVHYAISGSFEAEVIYSPFAPTIRRLQLSNINLTTDAPSYAGFGLPLQLSLSDNGALYMSNAACYEDYFYIPPGISWSCSGGNLGAISVNAGLMTGTGINLAGGNGWLFPNFSPLFESPTMPPPITDYSPVFGLYEYAIQATAIPEPGTVLLILSGLGLSGCFSRRRTMAARQRQ